MARGGGPKTKLTPETTDRLIQAIRMGSTYELACRYAGITYQTFLNWKEKAALGKDKIAIELFEGIARAEGEAAIKWLAIIEKHATDNPAWAAWKLERRYPDMYGRNRVELTGANGGPVVVKVEYVDSDPGAGDDSD